MARKVASVVETNEQERMFFSFQGEATNGRQISITLPNDQNGVVLQVGNAEHWNVRAASLRGNWRHACTQQVFERLRAVHGDNYKISTATYRLLSIGGVKGSGASRIMTPMQIAQAKAMNPLIEMLGGNEPVFFGGHLYPSHMLSEAPIDRDRSNSRAYHQQVVRRPLSHGPLKPDDLSDPEKMVEFAEVNRLRSQLETLGKTVYRLEAQLARKSDDRLKNQLETAFAELKKLVGVTFKSAAEVRDYIEQHLEKMRAAGHSTVSEQTIPVGQEVIPIGTRMTHTMAWLGASRIACGLLLDGISSRNFRYPYIGGRIASGCGGYLTTRYTVRRLEKNQWVDDCTIELIPEHHVKFHDAEHSLLRACLDEWLDCDITKFNFNYEALAQLAGNNGTAEC